MVERLSIIVDESGSRTVSRSFKELGSAARKGGESITFLQKALRGLAAAGAVAALGAATRASIELRGALAEVSTLLGDVPDEMAELSRQTKILAVEFGSLPTEQARAFYQIISAGATSAAKATEILEVANRLSVGGVTDLFTAADGLTSILNAYAGQVDSATDVSDALFTAVRDGKTTVDQLSRSIGRVAPLAAQTGVSIEELLSAVAALTKGGISTKESVTGVRAILAAVVKPTSEAAEQARQLGFDFSAAGLKAKGFEGFLNELLKATGGNTAVLGQLFGGVEALVPILALTGAAGADFAATLENMENKAGATEVAFNKLAKSPGFQLRRLAAAAKVELISLGDTLATVVAPAAKFLADNLGLVTAAAKGVAVALLLIGGPAILSALAAATKAVISLTVALAANPIGLIVIALGAAIGLLARFRNRIKASSDGLATLADVATVVWERIRQGFRVLVDPIINGFNKLKIVVTSIFGDIDFSIRGVLAGLLRYFDLMVNLYSLPFFTLIRVGRAIPEAFEQFGKAMANSIIGSVEFFVNKGIQGINKLVRGINKFTDSIGGEAAELLGFNLEIPEIPELELRRFKGTFTEGGLILGEAAIEAARDVLSRRPLSDLILPGVDETLAEAERRAQHRASDQRLIEIANNRQSEQLTTPSVPETETAPSSVRELNAALGEQNALLEEKERILQELRGPQEQLQLRQTALQELLSEGKISADEFAQAMRDLNLEMSSLDNTIGGGLLNGLQRIGEEAGKIGEQMSDFVVGAFNKATDAIVEFAKTGQFNVRQFFQDLFAQLLKLAANRLFSQLIGGIFGGAGGAGGGIGSLFGGLFGGEGFQNGGQFMVGGTNNSPDSQVVAFRATRGERVTIETPGQQMNSDLNVLTGGRSFRNLPGFQNGGGFTVGSGSDDSQLVAFRATKSENVETPAQQGQSNGSGQTVVQSPPVNVAAVLSPNDIVGAFDNPEGETVVINILQRNATTLRQIAGG